MLVPVYRMAPYIRFNNNSGEDTLHYIASISCDHYLNFIYLKSLSIKIQHIHAKCGAWSHDFDLHVCHYITRNIYQQCVYQCTL